MSSRMVKANPTREFFVNMLIRDILLKQAITELVDNSIDGARSIRRDKDYSAITISVTYDDNSFCIKDNCGGIPLEVAAEYAFRFGRPKGMEPSGNETTGIFGIGMKRALFKLGNYFSVRSITKTTTFEVDLDVRQWENEEGNNWDFPFAHTEENQQNSLDETGTEITVTRLREEVIADFKLASFEKELIEHIQRRVGLDIDNGLTITVNNKRLTGSHLRLVDGDTIRPVKETYSCGNVKVIIVAGIAEKNDAGKYEPENAGWYIYCNGRLVVAADKTSLTTWKDMENKKNGVVYTNTYGGFQGAVYFSSSNPMELPWNTTKTGIDESAPVYVQARERMKQCFQIVREFMDELREKTQKDDDGAADTVDRMQTVELTTNNIVNQLPDNRKLSVSDIKIVSDPKITISYKKPKKDVELLKNTLGVRTNAEVGAMTFDYYKDAEC